MKIQILLTSIVALVAAQDGLPQCAKDCVTKFTSGDNIGGCPQINAQCICSQQSFISGIACCLSSVCDEADQQAAVDYAVKFCSSFGVTVPSAVSCTSSATATAASTGTASSSGSATTTGATTTASGTAASGTAASTSSQNIGASTNPERGTAGILGGVVAAVLALL